MNNPASQIAENRGFEPLIAGPTAGFLNRQPLNSSNLLTLWTLQTFDYIKMKLTTREILIDLLQKGGVPAAPSGTATLLRLSPSHWFYPRPLLSVTDFRYPQLPWLDGRCVQGPGTYSPYHC
jgi:hypothetical protein